MVTTTCHWHPDRETGLTCSNCAKRICPECMRQHEVGLRCKECAQLKRLPTYRLSLRHYLQGIGAMLALGVLGGVALVLLDLFLPFAGLFRLLFMLGLGLAIGEGITRAVNRKRGPALQAMAGLTVFIAVAVAVVLGDPTVAAAIMFLWGNAGLFTGLWSLMGIAVATGAAITRLR